MGTAIEKQERIGARVPREVYETLNRAAELTGATLNQFLVQSALKEAQTVIEREQVIRLPDATANAFSICLRNRASRVHDSKQP